MYLNDIGQGQVSPRNPLASCEQYYNKNPTSMSKNMHTKRRELSLYTFQRLLLATSLVQMLAWILR